MLRIILPDQVPNIWPVLKQSLMVALDCNSDGLMSNALQALLSGRLVGWVYSKPHEGKTQIAALATTVLLTDTIMQSNTLMIYSIMGLERLDLADWQIMLDGIRQYAARLKAVRITAQVRNKKILPIITALGGQISATMIELEV